jgi:hypothetical protein
MRVIAIGTNRWTRFVTRLTLGLGILLVSGSSHHSTTVWEVGGAIGFGLIVLSLPIQGYDLYLRSLHGKRPHGIDLPKRSR